MFFKEVLIGIALGVCLSAAFLVVKPIIEKNLKLTLFFVFLFMVSSVVGFTIGDFMLS